MLGAVCVQLGLRVQSRAEARQCTEQRVDLVERVLARCVRVDLEPERDLIRAVRDAQPDLRLRRSAPPLAEHRVLYEHADICITVEAAQVEAELLVDAATTLGGGGSLQVLGEVRHHRPPFLGLICCGRVGAVRHLTALPLSYRSTRYSERDSNPRLSLRGDNRMCSGPQQGVTSRSWDALGNTDSNRCRP